MIILMYSRRQMVSFTAMQKETLTQKPLVINVHNYTESITSLHVIILYAVIAVMIVSKQVFLTTPPNWLNDWLYLLVGILKQKESGFHSTTELKKI